MEIEINFAYFYTYVWALMIIKEQIKNHLRDDYHRRWLKKTLCIFICIVRSSHDNEFDLGFPLEIIMALQITLYVVG